MRQVEDREAAGENLWTEDIEVAARRKIAHCWEVLNNDMVYGQEYDFDEQYTVQFRMDGHESWAKSPEDLVRVADTDSFLNHAEALYRSFKAVHMDAELFERVVNRVFNDHRVAFRLVEGEVVPLASDELHVEVVEPTLRLLVADKFKSAHDAYIKALKEISANDPGDAITDAATALQEALLALGCKGNALGPLMKDAKSKGILGAHDQPLIDGIAKFIDWVSSDRSTLGDAHAHSDAVLSDAWLAVHVVGALIVRLADPSPRGSTA